jgi:hypothetical protein
MVTEYATPRSVPFLESKFLFVLLWGCFCFFSKRIPRGTRFEVFSVTIRTCLKNNKSDTLKWPHTSVIFFQPSVGIEDPSSHFLHCFATGRRSHTTSGGFDNNCREQNKLKMCVSEAYVIVVFGTIE